MRERALRWRWVEGHGDLHLQHVWFERDRELPAMIDELSYDEKRNVKNVNRYVVRELSVLENKAQLYLSYLRASEPAATRFKADNDNDNISVAKVA